MIFNDDDKHHKPHVHVYYGENEASVALDVASISAISTNQWPCSFFVNVNCKRSKKFESNNCIC